MKQWVKEYSNIYSGEISLVSAEQQFSIVPYFFPSMPFLKNRRIKSFNMYWNYLSDTVPAGGLTTFQENVDQMFVSLMDTKGYKFISQMAVNTLAYPYIRGNDKGRRGGPNLFEFKKPLCVDWNRSYIQVPIQTTFQFYLGYIIDYE